MHPTNVHKMRFKIGDKVKFLNESGGGIVSRIVSNIMVNVAVEEGFDIPYMTSDLVLVESAGHGENLFNEDFKVKINSEADVETEKPEEKIVFQNSKNIKQAKEEQGVYLAFVPHDQKWLITGLLDVYLVNHTQYDILYSIYLKESVESL